MLKILRGKLIVRNYDTQDTIPKRLCVYHEVKEH